VTSVISIYWPGLSDRHSDAGLHNHPRYGRTCLRFVASDRRRSPAGTAHLPFRAVITITGGHGDFRSLSELPRRPGTLSRVEQMGAAIIADSPDEVRMRTREQLMQGASQIKLTAGGGVASPFSPPELRKHGSGSELLIAPVGELGDWTAAHGAALDPEAADAYIVLLSRLKEDYP